MAKASTGRARSSKKKTLDSKNSKGGPKHDVLVGEQNTAPRRRLWGGPGRGGK